MGVRTKALKEKLGDPKHLPSVTDAKAEYAKRMTQCLKGHIEAFKAQANKDFQPLLRRKEVLRNYHRKIREALKAKQEIRWQTEAQEQHWQWDHSEPEM